MALDEENKDYSDDLSDEMLEAMLESGGSGEPEKSGEPDESEEAADTPEEPSSEPVEEELSDEALNELLSGFDSGMADSELDDLLGDGAFADSLYSGGGMRADKEEPPKRRKDDADKDYEEVSFDELPEGTADDSPYEEISFDDIPDDSPYDDIFSIKKEEEAEIAPPLDDEESNSIYDLIDAELDDLDQFAVPDVDLSKNVEVFETPENDIEIFEGDEEQKTPVLVYVTLGVLAVSIIIVAVVFASLLLRKARMNEENKPRETTVLSKPEDIPNNLNYLYVNEKQTLNEQEIFLTKVLIDPVANVFYFDEYLDIRAYEFTLYDSQRRIHGMDLSYMYTQLTSGEETEEGLPGQETVVRFEPFASYQPGFALEITDIQTKEKIRFSYVIDSASSSTPVKYYNEVMPIDTNLSNIEATVENATFSSAGSIINYKISWQENQDVTLKFGDGNTPEAIAMAEKSRRLKPTRSAPLEYAMDDNTILGRMDFEPVSNLNSQVDLIFEDALMNVKYDQRLPLAPLFANSEETQVDIDLGGYKLVLERAGLQGNYYVLVFHAEDKSIVTESPEDLTNRVESNITAQLRAITRDGVEVVLEGEGRVSPYGTDMLFDSSGYAHIFSMITQDALMLDINSIDINLNDVKLTMDLTEADSDMLPDQEEALGNIKASFNSRLAYKSGKTLVEGISGFTTDVLTNPTLMQNYEPQGWEGDPLYTTQILSYAFDSDKLDAIVQETWKGFTAESEIHFYRTHKVKCELRSNGWVIVDDRLVN